MSDHQQEQQQVPHDHPSPPAGAASNKRKREDMELDDEDQKQHSRPQDHPQPQPQPHMPGSSSSSAYGGAQSSTRAASADTYEDSNMHFDPHMQPGPGPHDLGLDHGHMDIMQQMHAAPSSTTTGSQQNHGAVDENALSTAKAALAAQQSPSQTSKYPPPTEGYNGALATHGISTFTTTVTEGVHQMAQQQSTPQQQPHHQQQQQLPHPQQHQQQQQSGTPAQLPQQPGQLVHVTQVTQAPSPVPTSAASAAPAQTPPAVAGAPPPAGHVAQPIAMQHPHSHTHSHSHTTPPAPSSTSPTANAVFAAREPGSNKPSVGSPEWHTIRKNNHKEVERRRRETINEGINEIAKMVPGSEKAKGMILQRAIQYIQTLQQEAKDMAARWETANMTTSHALSEIGAENTKLKTECNRRGEVALKWLQRCKDAGLQYEDYEEDQKGLGAVSVDMHDAVSMQQSQGQGSEQQQQAMLQPPDAQMGQPGLPGGMLGPS